MNLLGAWVRVAGYQPNKMGFAINFVGQRYLRFCLFDCISIAALAQTFILGVPPKVAANWFGEHERATATSIGALCNQVGTSGNVRLTLLARNRNWIFDVPSDCEKRR